MTQFASHFSTAADIASIIGYIGAMIGMVISIKSYRNAIARERLAREYGTFDDLDNKYVEFMYKCTQFPHLDIFSSPIVTKGRVISLSDLQTERALFAVLISIFERVFIMFEQRVEENIHQRQYSGWIDCMRSYCLRDSFLAEWQAIGCQFDTGFQQKMDQIIEEEKQREWKIHEPANQASKI